MDGLLRAQGLAGNDVLCRLVAHAGIPVVMLETKQEALEIRAAQGLMTEATIFNEDPADQARIGQ